MSTLSRYTEATVTSTSPLKIATVSDPTHPIPARTVAGFTPTVSTTVLVRVELVTPFAPIIQGLA